MPRPSTTRLRLRLLGAFAVEVNAGRPIAVALRSKKARALLAYLAMKPDWRASREELATLLWGDTPDAQARHSLRQCLMSLRQDLHLAPDLIDLGRDTIELRPQALSVDARELAELAASGKPCDLDRAAELWRGTFLADLALDTEEFDAWRAREQDRLAAVVARVLEGQCAAADTAGDGEAAVAAAERLVALDPTREDRQRVALKIVARHRGRDAALDRAKQLTTLLRNELAVAPDAKTKALIEEIRNGELPFFTSPLRGEVDAPSGLAFGKPKGELRASGEGSSVIQLRDIEPLTPALSPSGRGGASTELVAAKPAAPLATPSRLAFLRRRPIAAALAMVSAVSLGAVAVLELAAGMPIAWTTAQPKAKVSAQPGLASAIVLPFSVDAPGDARDPALARLLTRDLTDALARFGDLRIISDRTADLYRDRDVDVAKLGTELSVRYAIVGHVQQTGGELRAGVQLVDTATRTTLWSDHMRREPGEPAQLADEIAHGLARMVAINITYAEARRLPFGVDQLATVRDLLLRAHVAEMRAYMPDNLAAAMRYYEEALRRAPRNRVAMLGIARMNIIAAMNFVDLDTPPDIPRADRLLNEVLAKAPNWAGAHYTLGVLQKYRGQFDAGMQSFQRALELNPTFLPARGQIATLLTRMGQPEKALETIRETLRLASPNDPGLGFLYLFAGEAELELGHGQAALAWIQRANTVMPGAPLVQAWLASVYTAIGDQPNAAKHIAALKRMAPAGAQRFAARKFGNAIRANGYRRSRILQELHVALVGPLG